MKIKLFFLITLNISFSVFGFCEFPDCKDAVYVSLNNKLNIYNQGMPHNMFHYLATDLDFYVMKNGIICFNSVFLPNKPFKNLKVCPGDKIIVAGRTFDRDKDETIINWDSYCATLKVDDKIKNNYINFKGDASFDKKTQLSSLKNISIESSFKVLSSHHKTGTDPDKMPVIIKNLCE